MSEGKCPKCGANFTYKLARGVVLFDCNTAIYPTDKVSQSYPCQIRVLESTVARLRKALEEIVAVNWSGMDCQRIAKTALEETK